MKKLLLFSFFFWANFVPNNMNAQVTKFFKDLSPGMNGGFDDEDTGLFASLDSVAFFLAEGKSETRLVCRTDGSNAGTFALLSPIQTGQFAGHVSTPGLCWFAINHDTKAELYSSDGTLAGTKMRYSLPEATFKNLHAFKNGVVFHESIGFEDRVVRFDNDTQTGFIVADCSGFGGVRDLNANDTYIYIIGATADNTGRYLLRTKGAAITDLEEIAVLNTGSEFNQAVYLTLVGEQVFFFWQKNGEAYQLWTSDGTEAGTIPLHEFEMPAFQDLRKSNAVMAFDNRLIFSAKDPGNGKGYEIWASDGTASGTVLLKDIATGGVDGMPRAFTVWQNRLYFSSRNEWWNRGIWSTDGTPAGTLETFNHFQWNESHGFSLCVFRDSLAFEGYTEDTGNEIFLSLQSDASLKVVSDASLPGSFTLSAANLMPTSRKLFFAGTEPSKGRELWYYDPYEKALVAVKTPDVAGEWAVFPNPGSANLQVETGEMGRLSVFSSSGTSVWERDFQGGLANIDTANWPNGIYAVRFWGKTGSKTAIWVKI